MNLELLINHNNKALENIITSNLIKDINENNEINFIKENNEEYKTRDISLSLILEIIGGLSSIVSISEIIYKYVFEKNASITLKYEEDKIVLTSENVTKDIIESFLKKHINKNL